MTKSFVLVYGETRLPYEVNEDPGRSTRVAIHVDPDGAISVDAPSGYSDEAIKSAVQKRARWITSHVAEAVHRFAHVRPREYVSGEQVLYLGRRYILKVIITDTPLKSAKLRGNRLEVQSRAGDFDEIKGRVRGWFRARAREYFAHRLGHLSSKLPWVATPPQFRLLDMSRQWGSCSPSGSIILNPHLVKAPSACVDYVIVHKLIHLKHHNHSSEFFRMLNSAIPEWQSHKHTLDGMVEMVLQE